MIISLGRRLLAISRLPPLLAELRRTLHATNLALAPKRVFHGASLEAVPRELLPHDFSLTLALADHSSLRIQAVYSLLHFP